VHAYTLDAARTSLCSASYAGWKRDTARIAPLQLSAGRAAIDRYLRPAGRPASNPPHAAAAVDSWDIQTDAQTDGHCIVTILCRIYYASSVDKAVVDVRLRPRPPCPLVSHREYTPLSRRLFPCATVCKHDVIHKPEVHNISQRRYGGTESRPHVTCTVFTCFTVCCVYILLINYLRACIEWLGSRVVSVLDSGAEGPGFKSQSRRCRVTVLGKMFTPIAPLFTKQQNR